MTLNLFKIINQMISVLQNKLRICLTTNSFSDNNLCQFILTTRALRALAFWRLSMNLEEKYSFRNFVELLPKILLLIKSDRNGSDGLVDTRLDWYPVDWSTFVRVTSHQLLLTVRRSRCSVGSKYHSADRVRC